MKRSKNFYLIGLGASCLLGSFLSSCSSNTASSYSTLSDFSGSTIGAQVGSAFSTLMGSQDVITNYTIEEYAGYDTMIQAAQANKISSFLADAPVAEAIISED